MTDTHKMIEEAREEASLLSRGTPVSTATIGRLRRIANALEKSEAEKGELRKRNALEVQTVNEKIIQKIRLKAENARLQSHEGLLETAAPIIRRLDKAGDYEHLAERIDKALAESMTHTDLLARLEAAEPDQIYELAREVVATVELPPALWQNLHAAIDTAEATKLPALLVGVLLEMMREKLPDAWWTINAKSSGSGSGIAEIYLGNPGPMVGVEGATPALALAIAIVKALDDE